MFYNPGQIIWSELKEKSSEEIKLDRTRKFSKLLLRNFRNKYHQSLIPFPRIA